MGEILEECGISHFFVSLSYFFAFFLYLTSFSLRSNS